MIRRPPRSTLFPYTRSSDLYRQPGLAICGLLTCYFLFLLQRVPQPKQLLLRLCGSTGTDRKSTRLNSSHLVISYAVFCLKKKPQIYTPCLAPHVTVELPLSI